MLPAFALLLGLCAPTGAQETPPVPPAEGQFFAGSVTALTKQKITVARSVLGKSSEVRAFVITPETRVEGSLRTRSRVTVRFVTKDEADQAVHIIVRTGQKK